MDFLFGTEKNPILFKNAKTISFKMTRVKYNRAPKLTREQLIPILNQQTVQVSLLLQQLEEAYMYIKHLEERREVNEDTNEKKEKVVDKDVEEMKKVEVNKEEWLTKKEEEDVDTMVSEGSNRKTLLVMDSHVKCILSRKIENVLGGRLYTGQFCCEMRAYNSGPWCKAKKPLQNQKAVVPNLLKRRPYTNMIMNASCNDISNIKHIEDTSLILHMAKKSSLNTVSVAVSALEEFPSLKNILIIPRSPRADSKLLEDLTNYANYILVSAIANTGLPNIKLGTMASIPCKTELEKTELFGAGPKSDLLHMKGARGGELYTDAIVTSIKENNLSKA